MLALQASGQSDLERLVKTEQAFAQMAAEKGTRAAFLANMTDDAFVFGPDRTGAKASWSARPDTAPGAPLLLWAPNYADISADGKLGYTTGNWEWHAKKGDSASAFGDFITVWLRQPDGSYKWVIDIGTTHPSPVKYSTDWTTSAVKRMDHGTKFPTLLGAPWSPLKGDPAKWYETYAAPDIRLYREGKLPIVGKKATIAELEQDKGAVTTSSLTTRTYADLSYDLGTYGRTVDGKEIEKGNYMQIWKLVGGKCQIVLDIFKPVPPKQ